MKSRKRQGLGWPAVAGLGALVVALLPGCAGAGDGELLAPGAQVEKLADGFAFTEGPACDADGNLYFSDIPKSHIHRWSVDGELTTFRRDTGRANGLSFDGSGNLLICEGGNRRITSLSPRGELEVVAERYGGKRFNSPNDLWIDPRGGVYFSDPRYGEQTGVEQDGFHVYYAPPGGGEVRRVVSDLVRPNGVIGTRDGARLYVADHGDAKTWAYRVGADGALSEPSLFASQGADGVALDERGNLYLADATLSVYSPDGKKLADIEVPERPSNATFCGPDRRTLFITARTGLYSLRMAVGGG